MKPPIAYYGGKQRLCRDILQALYQSPNWSDSAVYVEPFVGGGAVYFGKRPNAREVINDANADIANFYRCVKDPDSFRRLRAALDGTLYSRTDYARSVRILKGQEKADPILRAWAAFVHLNSAFGNSWFGGWSYSASGERFKSGGGVFRNKIDRLTEAYMERLSHTDVLNADVLDVLSRCDSSDALFYLDPPYAGAEQSYGKYTYTQGDLAQLLGALSSLKGRFVMSNYMCPRLQDAVRDNGWFIVSKTVKCSLWSAVTAVHVEEDREELLIANYPLSLKGWSPVPL